MNRPPQLPFDPATLALHQARIRQMVEAGSSDAEIADALLFVWSNGVQRQQLDMYLAALRQSLEAPRPPTPPRAIAPRASTREMIDRIPEAVAHLRRNRLPVTHAAVSTRIGCDRSTLEAWISRGYVVWPPA